MLAVACAGLCERLRGGREAKVSYYNRAYCMYMCACSVHMCVCVYVCICVCVYV